MSNTLHPESSEKTTSLSWSLTFLLIALIAGVLGISKIFFFIFLILLIVSAIVTALRGRPPI